MTTRPENLVPKVHPATRAAEPDDPYTLHATPVPGDPDVLVRSVVQEYAAMGWDAGQILALFRDPFFPMLHGLAEALGEDGVRDRIDHVFRRYGVYRFRASVREEPEDDEPRLVQIGLLPTGGGGHGHGL